MTLHDTPDVGQAHAGSREFIGVVEPLEHFEELLGKSGIEPHPVVPDEHHHLITLTVAPHPDPGLLPASAELHRVGQKVHHGLPEEQAVPLDGGQILHREVHPAFLAGEVQILHHGIHNIPEVHGGLPQLGPGQPGEGQQVVDELGHLRRAGPDDSEDPQPVLVQPGSMVLFQDPGKTVDGANGSLEVVGDGVAERLQLPVGGLQGAGPLLHPGFQLRSPVPELSFGFLPLRDVPGHPLDLFGVPLLVEEDLGVDLDGDGGAVGPEHFGFEHDSLLIRPPGHRLLHKGEHLRVVGLVGVVAEPAPHPLLRRVSREAPDGRVHVGELHLHVHGPDHVQGVLGQEAILGFAGPKKILGPLAVRDVPDRGNHQPLIR